jgi:hypothetical protein
VLADGVVVGRTMKVTRYREECPVGVGWSGSHVAARAATIGNELPHAAAKATQAAAPQATEASTAAPRRIASTPTHAGARTREAPMATFA